jgi:prepilin-type N-terminal cleavage/methylation domain-containing protein
MVTIFKKNSPGYTLIELLTVITIIGILSTIAIPHYIAHRDNAKMATVYATLHQIQLAQEVYKTNKQLYFSLGDTVVTHDDSPLEIADTDLELYIPAGQSYQIKTEAGTAETKYEVRIQTNFDLNMDGLNDLFLFASDKNSFPLYPTTF